MLSFVLLPQRKKERKTLLVIVKASHSPSFNLFFIYRQDKDSKDEAVKAEKELEEIRKVIEESGGKLSNRLLQSDVRKQLIVSNLHICY